MSKEMKAVTVDTERTRADMRELHKRLNDITDLDQRDLWRTGFNDCWDARDEEVYRLSCEYGDVSEKLEIANTENKRLTRIIAQELTENDELGCEFVYVNALKEENKRLKAIEQDHLDDWRRIQDAERKCEVLEAEIKRLREELSDIATLHDESIGRWAEENKRLKAEIERLKNDQS